MCQLCSKRKVLVMNRTMHIPLQHYELNQLIISPPPHSPTSTVTKTHKTRNLVQLHICLYTKINSIGKHSRVELLCIVVPMYCRQVSNSNTFQCTLNVHRIASCINCNWAKVKTYFKISLENKRSTDSLVQKFNHPETRLLYKDNI